MRKSSLFIIVVAVVLIAAVAFVFTYYDFGLNSQDSQQNLSSGIQPANMISQSELSLHNIESDCWVSYKGEVYDVTSFLPKHPGSAQAIILYCGTSSEFEQAFEGKHGTFKVETLRQQGMFKGELS